MGLIALEYLIGQPNTRRQFVMACVGQEPGERVPERKRVGAYSEKPCVPTSV